MDGIGVDGLVFPYDGIQSGGSGGIGSSGGFFDSFGTAPTFFLLCYLVASEMVE